MRRLPDSDDSRSVVDSIDTSVQSQQGELAVSALELAKRLRGTVASQLVELLEPKPQASTPADDGLDLYA